MFSSSDLPSGPTIPPRAYVSKAQEHLPKEVALLEEISQISTFLKSSGEDPAWKPVEGNGFCLDCRDPPSSESSSSIGAVGESSSMTDGGDDGGADDEVQSLFKGGLGSLESLESSLPIKRGLSKYFNGKSKSFASLSDVANISDLTKQENPFNKRRRILMGCKQRSFFNSLPRSLPFSSPDLTLKEINEEKEDSDDDNEDNDDHNKEEDEDDEEEEQFKVSSISPMSLHKRKFKSFNAPRSFSLSDLRDV